MKVLGNTNLYPECNNHSRLQEPWRRHEYNQITPKDDKDLSVGWYRIFGQAGERLLDINDIPTNIFNKSFVSLVLISPCVKYLTVVLINLAIL